ncbi:hypothetical protein UPYG_G00058820 [Umbra pygmaea]|uniref:Myb/SANT-like DNA-binding domain-containing protein n=1 Tax=Umbra pygmaea TaxID=75934 RepID=A0ABD0X9H4_UMBPY
MSSVNYAATGDQVCWTEKQDLWLNVVVKKEKEEEDDILEREEGTLGVDDDITGKEDGQKEEGAVFGLKEGEITVALKEEDAEHDIGVLINNTIFLDRNMDMFLDAQRTTPFSGVLFQRASDPTMYYLDEKLTVMVNVVEARYTDSSSVTDTSRSSSSSPSPVPLPFPANECFTRNQTLFLIDLIRHHLEAEGEGLPETLQDLNARLKTAKSNKKKLWKDTAEELGSHFKQSFCPDKVARKWNTLVDGYKKVKDNNSTTGKGAMRFQFFTEMGNLLGGHNEIVFPVVGTAGGLEVRRPEMLGHCSSVPPLADTACSPSSTPVRTKVRTPTPSRKRKRVDDEVMRFLQEAEGACQKRHAEILAQLRSAQQSFESLMTRLLDKL